MTARKKLFINSVQKELADNHRALKEYVHGDPLIAAHFESHGIPVTTRYIRGGLSIYTKARKTPITRFVPTGSGDSVEVM